MFVLILLAALMLPPAQPMAIIIDPPLARPGDVVTIRITEFEPGPMFISVVDPLTFEGLATQEDGVVVARVRVGAVEAPGDTLIAVQTANVRASAVLRLAPWQAWIPITQT